MKILKFIFALVLGCFLFSCTQSPSSTIIEGTLLQYGSLEPVEGAKVEILEGNVVGGLGGTVEVKIDEIFSDSNGKFKWESSRNPGSGWFEIGKVTKENYFDSTPILTGETNTVSHLDRIDSEIILSPHAWIKFILYDDINIESDYCKIWGDYFQAFQVELGSQETTRTIIVPGNKFNPIHIKFSDDVISIEDTVLTISQDTILYHVNF